MLQTSLRGGVAGAVATVVMTLEQPLDKRLFDSKYDDVEILGKLVTRGDDWRPIGFALHVQNGAILGAAYARLKPSLPGPAVLRGLLAGLIEHVAAWPMTVLFDRYHPARKELPKLAANRSSLRPGDDPPRSVRDRPRAPRGRAQRPQRIRSPRSVMTSRSARRSHEEFARVLRRAGYSDEFISDVLSQLPDPIDFERDQQILARYGLSPELLMDRMGGSP